MESSLEEDDSVELLVKGSFSERLNSKAKELIEQYPKTEKHQAIVDNWDACEAQKLDEYNDTAKLSDDRRYNAKAKLRREWKNADAQEIAAQARKAQLWLLEGLLATSLIAKTSSQLANVHSTRKCPASAKSKVGKNQNPASSRTPVPGRKRDVAGSAAQITSDGYESLYASSRISKQATIKHAMSQSASLPKIDNDNVRAKSIRIKDQQAARQASFESRLDLSLLGIEVSDEESTPEPEPILSSQMKAELRRQLAPKTSQVNKAGKEIEVPAKSSQTKTTHTKESTPETILLSRTKAEQRRTSVPKTSQVNNVGKEFEAPVKSSHTKPAPSKGRLSALFAAAQSKSKRNLDNTKKAAAPDELEQGKKYALNKNFETPQAIKSQSEAKRDLGTTTRPEKSEQGKKSTSSMTGKAADSKQRIKHTFGKAGILKRGPGPSKTRRLTYGKPKVYDNTKAIMKKIEKTLAAQKKKDHLVYDRFESSRKPLGRSFQDDKTSTYGRRSITLKKVKKTLAAQKEQNKLYYDFFESSRN